MGNLTQKDRRTLEHALDRAKAARDYIMSERIALCKVDTLASTSMHFTRGYDSRILYEIERSYGSQLVGLEDAIKILSNFLESH